MEQFYTQLSEQYLFVEVSKKIKAKKDIIDLSVGDVRLPLPKAICEAGERAAREMGNGDQFRGYPPERGYDFMRRAVKEYYGDRVALCEDEIFISDGIKSELSMFLDLFLGAKVILQAPTYPAYLEANILKGNKIEFCSSPPDHAVDLVILCSPHNPTGEVMTLTQLKEWVDYCLRCGATLVFDAAYEAFAAEGEVKSVFEAEGARECAVEMCSLSKTAGFTGLRCGYTVICKENRLNSAWRRVKSCTSNGVSYITQRMAECALTSALDGIRANVDYYLKNARIIMEALYGMEFSGGSSSPYIWLRCGADGFDRLLDCGVGVTPGIGFGEAGKEYVRINSFCLRSEAIEAAKRLKSFAQTH